MSKTFCVRPWIHQQINSDGSIKVCCVSLEDNVEFNAASANLQQSFNSDTLKRIRTQMLNGEWPNECKVCRIEEEANLGTARTREIEQWKDRFTFDDAVATTNGDGSVNYGPRYLDLRFGNFCNLKCRICGPASSHSLYEEWAEYFGEEGFFDNHGYIKLVRNSKGRLTTTKYDWHLSELFWNQLEQSINNLEYIFMAGGEPLLIKRKEDFLKMCIDKGVANKIVLAYSTNLSSIPEKLLELWKNFKQVRISASIDGMGKVLEYQRYPIKWNSTLKNLQKLDKLSLIYPNIMSVINLTITVYNVFHLPEFMWWKINESKFKSINTLEQFPIIITHLLHNPNHLNIQVLPNHIKDNIKDCYTDWINKFEGNLHAIEILQTTLNFMYADDKSENLPEFVKFTKFLDQSRGQNLKDVVPQLSELI